MSTLSISTDKNKALMITIAFHILVVLLFVLIKYTIPEQIAIEEYGMEVNLGNSDDGFGDDQPEDPNAPSMSLAGAAGANTRADNTPDYHTDPNADENTTAVHKSRNRQHTQTTLQQQDNNQQRNRTSRFGVSDALSKSGNLAENTKDGGSQGDGSGNGDKGKPGGDPNATNYDGNGGTGNSVFSHTLKGRYVEKKPSNTAKFSKSGRVRVSIRVDRQGNVTVTGISGSSDPQLNAVAKQKAQAHKFNANPNAPIEQKGEIIVNFTVGK